MKKRSDKIRRRKLGLINPQLPYTSLMVMLMPLLLANALKRSIPVSKKKKKKGK